MRIPFIHGPGRVGREDRLVRGCIALSLVLLAGFAVTMSGQTSPISIAFGVLGLFFTVTATLGRDPFYAHFDIDTRTDAELARSTSASVGGFDEPHQWIDLRDPQPTDDHSDTSLLGT